MATKKQAAKPAEPNKVLIFPKGTTTIAFLDWCAAAAKFRAQPSEASASLCRTLRKRYYLLSNPEGTVPAIDEVAVDAMTGAW